MFSPLDSSLFELWTVVGLTGRSQDGRTIPGHRWDGISVLIHFCQSGYCHQHLPWYLYGNRQQVLLLNKIGWPFKKYHFRNSMVYSLIASLVARGIFQSCHCSTLGLFIYTLKVETPRNCTSLLGPCSKYDRNGYICNNKHSFFLI